MNKLVDKQLELVVEKINQKKVLEKQNRELCQKLQKRQDEVNSLEHQRGVIVQQVAHEQQVIQPSIRSQIALIREQIKKFHAKMEEESKRQKEEFTECLAERMQVKEYVHERKESLLVT